MEAIEAILTRRSIRKYTDRPISDEDMTTLLRAGMSAPSCTDCRDWAFLVVRDKATLEALAENNGSAAWMLPGAAAAIVVCGDLSRAYADCPDYWVIDAANASENILVAANALGIGSVFLGTYPELDLVEGLRRLLQLPGEIVPFAILSLGYPAAPERAREKDNFEPERIHYETW